MASVTTEWADKRIQDQVDLISAAQDEIVLWERWTDANSVLAALDLKGELSYGRWDTARAEIAKAWLNRRDALGLPCMADDPSLPGNGRHLDATL